jgi:hypothetical protein
VNMAGALAARRPVLIRRGGRTHRCQVPGLAPVIFRLKADLYL